MTDLDRRAALAAGGLAGAASVELVSLATIRAAESLPPIWSLVAVALLATLFVLPLATALIAAVRGLPALIAGLAGAGAEPAHAVLRVAAAAAMMAFAGGALLLHGDVGHDALAPPALDTFVVAGLGAALAWLFLIQILLFPTAGPWRRAVAVLADVAVLSLFLHAGGPLAAGWYPAYLGILFGNGLRFGRRALLFATALAAAGFLAVVATTGFWRDNPMLAAGSLAGLLLLPLYARALLRGLAAATARAEEASAAKSRFLAMMSHELRTPLDAAVGAGALLGRTRLDGEQKDMVSAIQLAARTLRGVIDDVLDYSRIDLAGALPERESYDPHEVARAALALVRPDATAKGLQLGLRVDPHLPARLLGWPRQMQQILLNLLTNAVKFTDKGRVRLAVDRARAADGGLCLRITVRDQGAGIPREALERIFDPFTQADEGAGRRHGGTGLAIVKQLAMLMGGAAAVENAPGIGSAFVVELPAEADPRAAPRSPDLAGRPVGIVTGDRELARELAARVRDWNGAPAWQTDIDGAIAGLTGASPAALPPVLLLDGRGDPVAALGLAHRAAPGRRADEPLVIFIADPAAGEHVLGIAEDHVAAVLALPLDEALLANALRALPPAEAPASAGFEQRFRVLVAEGSAATRSLIERILVAAGHEVELAADGEQALRTLEGAAVDIALVDINMPGLSGYDTARRLRAAHPEGPRVPLVALSADVTDETERRCREAGMDAVLTKPIEPMQLLTAIAETATRVGVAPTERGFRPAGAAVPATVTSIAAHPKFAHETVAETAPESVTGTADLAVDEAALDALRALGAGSDFFAEVIDAFRRDGRQIVDSIRTAAIAGDVDAFTDHLHALRSSAANVGGTQLCRTLQALGAPGGRELRQQSNEILERLQREFDRLDTALANRAHGATRAS